MPARAPTSGSLLLASVLETDGYVVGSNNGPSGLHVFHGGAWHHRGWRNVRAFSLAIDGPRGVLLACGNGLLTSANGGESWRVESDWRVTEVLDVLPGWTDDRVLLATAHGAWSWNRDTDWQPQNDGLSCRFVSRLSRLADGRVLGATETGLAVLDARGRWTYVGPPAACRCVTVSTSGDTWVLGTERRGTCRSFDRGATWDWSEGPEGFSIESIYALAVHPERTGTFVAGGLSGNVWLSEDDARSWHVLVKGNDPIHALAFDLGNAGILHCGRRKSGISAIDIDTATVLDSALDKAFVSRIVVKSQAANTL